MVGMLAAAGTLDQLNRPYARIWGQIEDPSVLTKVMSFIRSAGALAFLRGQTYGLFGGRPLGMYTAVANLDEWQKLFGIDVEHIRAARHRGIRQPRGRSTSRARAPVAGATRRLHSLRR